MPTNQEIASASKSNDPNCISFFGPPPLLKGEDPRAYDDLLLRVLGAVNPSDLFEEIWTRDYVDHTWEVFRGRRLKASLLTAKMTVALERLLVRPLNLPLELEYISVFKPTLANELAQKWAARDPSAIKSVEELLATVGRTIESVQSSALEMAIDCIGRIDRLIVSAEARRNSAWREINRHRDRKAFARSLRDEVRNIENAEVKRDEIIRPADAADKDAA